MANFPRIPDEVRAHKGDVPWLEEHGRAALDAYVESCPTHQKPYAGQVFAGVMFTNPETGIVLGCAPPWYWKEYREKLKRAKRKLGAIHPAIATAFAEKGAGEEPVTVVEVRGEPTEG